MTPRQMALETPIAPSPIPTWLWSDAGFRPVAGSGALSRPVLLQRSLGARRRGPTNGWPYRVSLRARRPDAVKAKQPLTAFRAQAQQRHKTDALAGLKEGREESRRLEMQRPLRIGQTWPGPPLPQWGVKPTHLNLSSGRHLPRAMMPKFST